MTTGLHPDPSGAPRGTAAAAAFRWLLVLLTLAAAAGAVAWWIGTREADPAAAAAASYHCPMHPQIISDRPGSCPICGMDLVVVAPSPPDPHAAHAEHAVPGLVPLTLSGDRVQLLGMRSEPVQRQAVAALLRVPAWIAPDERRLAAVQGRAMGWIEELRAAETGRRVARGEVLATVYSPDLLARQEELLAARRLDPALVADARRRLELLGVDPADIAQVEATGEPLRALPVRAPRDGFLVRKAALPGMAVEPGMELFAVAALDRVWAQLDLWESDAARVRVGLEAELRLAAFPDRRFSGRVDFVAPQLDPMQRTLQVRVELANPDLLLRPGLSGEALLRTAPTDGLWIPSDALVETGDARYAFVDHGDGRFEPRAVRPGERAAGRVQVLSGLSEGERVVTTALFLLDSESRVQAAVRQSADTPAAGPAGAAGHAGHGR